MSKIMPLELLSSIKGAQSSEAVNELFNVIRQAVPETIAADPSLMEEQTVSLDALRSDLVIESSEAEKEIIRKNFPGEKKGYLVVPKVIED